ncbi:Dps family protein [Ruicaihuangia caeni]|uniref:Dps family protein n=1 Tax=Ruicaihuangia caeni TaxID=3042517 RepID=UPI00338D617B
MKASRDLSASLQAVLVDLIALSLQAKQAHWSIVGPNFRGLHLQLDEVTVDARRFADQVAERMRALQAVPDGSAATVAGTASFDDFPAGEVLTTDAVVMITDRLESVVGTMRDVHDAVEEEDPTSADLLHAIIERFEQLAWMVSAEDRMPQAAADAETSTEKAASGKKSAGAKSGGRKGSATSSKSKVKAS